MNNKIRKNKLIKSARNNLYAGHRDMIFILAHTNMNKWPDNGRVL